MYVIIQLKNYYHPVYVPKAGDQDIKLK